MSIRYFSNLALALAAGFLVVATMAFSPAVAAALTFAIGIGATVAGVFISLVRPTLAQRIVGGLVVPLGAWTIVASLVFAPATVVWLGFAAALGWVGLAVAGLTAHELGTERVVHSLEVAPQRERETAPTTRIPTAA